MGEAKLKGILSETTVRPMRGKWLPDMEDQECSGRTRRDDKPRDWGVRFERPGKNFREGVDDQKKKEKAIRYNGRKGEIRQKSSRL